MSGGSRPRNFWRLYSADHIGAIDAHEWSSATKWLATFIIAWIAGVVAFAAAVDSAAIPQISSEFRISKETESLATGTFFGMIHIGIYQLTPPEQPSSLGLEQAP